MSSPDIDQLSPFLPFEKDILKSNKRFDDIRKAAEPSPKGESNPSVVAPPPIHRLQEYPIPKDLQRIFKQGDWMITFRFVSFWLNFFDVYYLQGSQRRTGPQPKIELSSATAARSSPSRWARRRTRSGSNCSFTPRSIKCRSTSGTMTWRWTWWHREKIEIFPLIFLFFFLPFSDFRMRCCTRRGEIPSFFTWTYRVWPKTAPAYWPVTRSTWDPWEGRVPRTLKAGWRRSWTRRSS